MLPSPSDGEPQVLGEPSLAGCIHKANLPPPAFAMERFPPRVLIMKCHRGNSWNIICACLLSPTLPPLPPTSSLSGVMFAVQEKPFLLPSSPPKPAEGSACTSQSPPKIPLFISSSSVPCSKAKPTKLNWLLLQLPGLYAFPCQTITSVKRHYKEALSQQDPGLLLL